MIPFFLFFATAMAAAWLTHFWGGHGAASMGEQEIGFAGAIAMLLAAYISAFTLWAGRCVAALGLALIATYCLCENIGIFPRLITIGSALSLLLVAGAGVYVIGSFRVKKPSIYYPPRASPAGKAVVGLFIAAPAACFVWLRFWHDAVEVRAFTVPARWEAVTLEQVTSGRRQVRFTALDSSLSVTVASDELYNELESAQKKSVDVLIRETFKHGSRVAWSVESIDGSQDFSLLDRELKQ